MRANKGSEIVGGTNTITTTDLAKALGISRQAIRHRAVKHNWPTTGKRVQGGGWVYPVGQLPLTDKEWRKVSRYLIKKAEKQVKPVELPAPLHVEDKEDLGELRDAIGRALPRIGKEGLVAILHMAGALLQQETPATGIES